MKIKNVKLKAIASMVALFGALVTAAPANADSAVPKNPYLADSPWPMSHQNSYNQASSDYTAPLGEKELKLEYDRLPPGAITLAHDAMDKKGRAVIWVSTVGRVDKFVYRKGHLIKIDDYKLTVNREAWGLSGAYTLVDRDGRFFVPKGLDINVFAGKNPANPYSKIVLERTYKLTPEDGLTPDDAIVGMNITYDGWIVFASQKGVIGVISRDLKQVQTVVLPDEEISNSIAVDEDGGIYAVTSKKMRRIQWTGTELTNDESRGAWSADYITGFGDDVAGRLGEGSGSTPTLMGNKGEDQFVVITDGAKIMNLVLFWRNTIPSDLGEKRIADQFPVTFGQDDPDFTMSEQSVLVSGHDAMVVNNDYGLLNKLEFLSFLGQLQIFLTNLPGIAPYGVEKISWNPETRKLEQAWVNSAISCPNGIPTYSSASDAAYCIGQRGGAWTLEVIDWQTGMSLHYHEMEQELRYNSAYAATQIGYDGMVLSGTTFGIMQLR